MTNSDRTCTVDGCADVVYAKGTCHRHYLRDYYERNRERQRERNRKNYIENKDAYKRRANEQWLRYLATDPDAARRASVERANASRSKHPKRHPLREAARRASKRNCESRQVTDVEWLREVNRHGGRCFYCGVTGAMTQDHIIPLSRGGRHAIGNLIPACLSCNCSKNNLLLVEWRAKKASTSR